jgi:hypothetical protein
VGTAGFAASAGTAISAVAAQRIVFNMGAILLTFSR